MIPAAIFILAFLVSGLLTPVTVLLAEALGAWDLPSERKPHQRPITRLGGLAVFGGTLTALILVVPWEGGLKGLLCGAVSVYLLGFWEDVREIPAGVRLVCQFAAAIIALYWGMAVPTDSGIFSGAGLLANAAAVVWLVGITNALNMIDGIDGLAVTLGWVCAGLFAMLAAGTGFGPAPALAAALAGACLGFLPYNWNGALAFLGDSGAYFIGFILAGLGLMSLQGQGDASSAAVVAGLILGVPALDMIWTYFSRMRRGVGKTLKELLEYSGQDHIHHKLVRGGLSVPSTVFFLALLTGALGGGGFLIIDGPAGFWLALVWGGLLLGATVWVLESKGTQPFSGGGGSSSDRESMESSRSENSRD